MLSGTAAIQDRHAEFLHTLRISVSRFAWFTGAPATVSGQMAECRRACSNRPRSVYRFALSPADNALARSWSESPSLIAGPVEWRRINRRSRTFANHQGRAIAPLLHREIVRAARPCRPDSSGEYVHSLPPPLLSRRAVASLSPPNHDSIRSHIRGQLK